AHAFQGCASDTEQRNRTPLIRQERLAFRFPSVRTVGGAAAPRAGSFTGPAPMARSGPHKGEAHDVETHYLTRRYGDAVPSGCDVRVVGRAAGLLAGSRARAARVGRAGADRGAP